ncbi:MAG: hypothetical protein HDS65_08965 [Bacteroidales bacterium]|nr:hypothetical protein [Bacteroidales bacterium]
MKHFLNIIISLISLSVCGCSRDNKTHSHYDLRADTIMNDAFCYIPDTCIMDGDLFVFAKNLIDIEQIYADSITDAKHYKSWYKKTDSIYLSNLNCRNIEIDLCLEYISNNMIPYIKIYGNNCTAALGDAEWLNLGMNLYMMFLSQENILKSSNIDYSHWWKKENDAWLRFIAKLFPLLDHEICNVTGSSAAYEIPYTFNKIIQNRIICLKEVNADRLLNERLEISLDKLCFLITDINIRHMDCDKDDLIEDSFQLSNKKEALEALNQWVAIRTDMVKPNGNEASFHNATNNLLDSITSIIFHIRH